MTSETSLSVIVPVYNSADTLCGCVESVLKSDFKDLELILVDDGSSDESAEIIAEYRDMDSRVRFLKGEHMGAGAARNLGISEARGRWLSFVDADDYVESDFFSRLFGGLENAGGPEPMMSVCSYTFDFPGGEFRRAVMFSGGDEAVRADREVRRVSVDGMLACGNIYPLTGPVCKLFRRDIVEAAALRFPSDMKFGEDTAFTFAYIKEIAAIAEAHPEEYPAGVCLAMVPAWGYHYVKTDNGSLTSTAAPSDWVKAYKRFYELTARVSDLQARRKVEAHFAEGILTALKLDREKNELTAAQRGECYEMIYLMVSPAVFRPLMPWFFDTFGSFRLWRPYEWLYKTIYLRK